MKIKNLSIVFSFLLILILMISIISSFSLSGMVVSVDKEGWDVKVVGDKLAENITNETSTIPEETGSSTLNDSKDSVKEIKDSIEEGNSLEIGAGNNDVEISLNEDGTVEIDDGVAVQTDETIVINEGVLSIEDEVGNFIEISVLPTAAISNVVESGEISSSSNLKLKLYEGVPYYCVSETRETYFLGIVPTTKSTSAKIDATTGDELSSYFGEDKTFLEYFKDFFGFEKTVVC